MKVKNVLVIIPYFVPAYSYWWPVSVAYNYAKELVKRGYNVTVITTDTMDKNIRIKKLEEVIDWIKIIRFKNFSNYLAKKYSIYSPIWVAKWIKNNIKNFDIVHMHDFFSYMNVVTSVYCKKYNISYVVQPHWSANFSPKRWKSLIKRIFFELFWMRLLKCAKSVIAVSQYEKNNMYYRDKNKVEIIYNWIDVGLIQEQEKNIIEKDIDEFKKRFRLCWKKIILSVWRLHRIKRFDKLIDWSKDLLLKNKGYNLVIVWPDEWEMKLLKQKIKNYWLGWRVVLTWWLYGKEKYIAYNVADVFTLLSDSEAGGVTLVCAEAMYYNLPIVMSKWCGFEFENEFTKIVEKKTEFESAITEFINKKIKYSFWKNLTMNYQIDVLERVYKE